MAALHFAVVSGRVGSDEFMTDAKLLQCSLKERLFPGTSGVEPVGELFAVVGLDTLNDIWEALHTVFDELRGRI